MMFCAAAFLGAPVYAGPFMAEGGALRAPAGYRALCQRDVAACVGDRRPGGAPTRRLPRSLPTLSAVNRFYNELIAPLADVGDVWRRDARAGDCEDYALAKRAALMRAGWPADQVLIAIARTPEGAPHAALIVRLVEGDYVLDSRMDAIHRWDGSDLTFIARQSSALPALWVESAS